MWMWILVSVGLVPSEALIFHPHRCTYICTNWPEPDQIFERDPQMSSNARNLQQNIQRQPKKSYNKMTWIQFYILNVCAHTFGVLFCLQFWEQPSFHKWRNKNVGKTIGHSNFFFIYNFSKKVRDTVLSTELEFRFYFFL